MSGIEPVNHELPVNLEADLNTPEELTGMPAFYLPTFLERQGVIDDIMAKSYKTPEDRVTDLNRHIADWDDERGISYTYIAGRELPGLQVHVPATALAFAANYAPQANFEGANLDYAVLSASVLPDVNLKRSSLDHAVLPMAKISGDALGVSAVKSIMNLADISGLNMRGVDVAAGYLLGTRGIDEDVLLSLADAQEAISTLADAEIDPAVTALLSDGLGYFSAGDATTKDIVRRLRHPQVFSGVNASQVILRKLLRDRRKGAILDQVTLIGSEISKYDFEGNIWHGVIADRATAIATRFGGAILLNSSLDNVDTRGAKAPGLIAVNSSFRDTPLPKNAAGAVYFNSDLTGASVEEVQEGGTVIIGGKPPVIEEALPHIRVMTFHDVPAPVLANLRQYQNTSVRPQGYTSRAPELEA